MKNIPLTTYGPNGFGTYQVDFTDGGSFEKVNKAPKGFLVPGFVDIHCHGAFGIDFMSASSDDILTLAGGLRRCGYEGFLLTTVTSSLNKVEAALANIPDDSTIWGVHLEGPFISNDYPGAQPKEDILPLPDGPSQWDRIWADSRLKIVTLAPEIPHALELIPKLIQKGTLVSMGHTNATFEEARRGYEFGASHTTHTFNAMRGFHHREPGIVGYLLSNPNLVCEVIYDKHHVSKEALQLLLKSRPATKVIAVSDSTKATGLPPGTEVDMWGHPATIGKGEVTLRDGTLAGSCVNLMDVFINLHHDFGFETAVQLCCLSPRRALKREAIKTWVHLNSNLELEEIFHL